MTERREPRNKTCPECFSQSGYSWPGGDFECFVCDVVAPALLMSKEAAEMAARLDRQGLLAVTEPNDAPGGE